LDLAQLEQMSLTQLRQLARDLNLKGISRLKKRELMVAILRGRTEQRGGLFAEGILEVILDGYGFLRVHGYLPSDQDIYVSPSQIKRFALRTGDLVSGQIRRPREGERYPALLHIEAVNGAAPETVRNRPTFDSLTPIYPQERLQLERNRDAVATRLLDIISPVGKGQRGLIVAPPKAGKTMLLKEVANSLTSNYPELYLLVLLIDERPEEVTDMERSVAGEVISSTFDQLPENHVKVADMVLERAKRLVEQGKDVVILLDSITRLARAHNLVIPPSGRTLSGGLDPAALHKPKRFFGAARKLEEAGSLTILATALVETGSRMDDVIYEEFKGTGNMELHLDRRLAERRIFPAIDIQRSGTRKEELLFTPAEMELSWNLRRSFQINTSGVAEYSEFLLKRLSRSRNNMEFLASFAKDIQG
jgi:transcription termination factor Rho